MSMPRARDGGRTPTDWSRYPECERKGCRARAGEPCTNLGVTWYPGFTKRPRAERPHVGRTQRRGAELAK